MSDQCAPQNKRALCEDGTVCGADSALAVLGEDLACARCFVSVLRVDDGLCFAPVVHAVGGAPMTSPKASLDLFLNDAIRHAIDRRDEVMSNFNFHSDVVCRELERAGVLKRTVFFERSNPWRPEDNGVFATEAFNFDDRRLHISAIRTRPATPEEIAAWRLVNGGGAS